MSVQPAGRVLPIDFDGPVRPGMVAKVRKEWRHLSSARYEIFVCELCHGQEINPIILLEIAENP